MKRECLFPFMISGEKHRSNYVIYLITLGGFIMFIYMTKLLSFSYTDCNTRYQPPAPFSLSLLLFAFLLQK